MGLSISYDRQDYHKNVTLAHPVRGKKLFSDELALPFRCDLTHSMSALTSGCVCIFLPNTFRMSVTVCCCPSKKRYKQNTLSPATVITEAKDIRRAMLDGQYYGLKKNLQNL
jgi:hypothetical protein